uniref:Glutamine-dependent NAD(+) synthetase n=1 Tax=Aureoumbra lagunensis TaxID=44058 RepID=A0A7S3K3T2_9STRA
MSFFDMYTHNMCRVSVCVPRVVLGDAMANAAEIGRLYKEACREGAAVVLFPELCICGYALDDLLQQDAILDECLEALRILKKVTIDCRGLLIVGSPLRITGRLYNCGIVMAGGETLGVIPKSYPPNFREFYEGRYFISAAAAPPETFWLDNDRKIPFGNHLIFKCIDNPTFCFGVEICQDVWVPIPPSTYQALAGATILLNLSASNITIGKSSFRHELVAATSARLLAAYAYSSAGQGESTNDLAWDGQALIFEAGDLIAESGRFVDESTNTYADIDLDRLVQDRTRDATWANNARDHAQRLANIQSLLFNFSKPQIDTPPTLLAYRRVPKRPYVPSDPKTLAQRCYEVFNIQVSGLIQRIRSSGINKLVLGISGGLDSTHALLVCCRALDTLKLPRTNIYAYTMPAFATSTKTKEYATRLMKTLQVEANEIDVRPSCHQMLKDLGHPYAQGIRKYDVTFENVQAGERTNHLFRIANHRNAFVVGTGDLSELAMGWCTYGVGDHMSHYSVNASLSKSLIQCVIQWVIDSTFFGDSVNSVLSSILALEISPELVPQHSIDEEEDDEDETQPQDISTTSLDMHSALQSTEAALGPYDLHDFQLYHATRRGLRPAKAAFLACFAWANDFPRHPHAMPVEPQPSLSSGSSVLKDRNFSIVQIFSFQRIFFRRFFLTTQFKRTCVPNAPKVGDGSSLSPRGDWRAPSDSSWRPWERAWIKTMSWALESSIRLRDQSSSSEDTLDYHKYNQLALDLADFLESTNGFDLDDDKVVSLLDEARGRPLYL